MNCMHSSGCFSCVICIYVERCEIAEHQAWVFEFVHVQYDLWPSVMCRFGPEYSILDSSNDEIQVSKFAFKRSTTNHDKAKTVTRNFQERIVWSVRPRQVPNSETGYDQLIIFMICESMCMQHDWLANFTFRIVVGANQYCSLICSRRGLDTAVYDG
ncbi:hypothetical protein BC835DRAFT_357676 [Cytidiella melzeri]|nr:hypothetical protein BC835DRAFT_357676 [Cytidiella melzeri]